MAWCCATMKRRGFTLIELLVVLVIIAVLIGILLPVLSHMKQRARATATAGTINNITVALEAYRTELRQYPAANMFFVPDADGGYEFNALALALTGYRDAAGDSQEGPGFRLTAKGKVFGPYLQPTAKNFRRFTTVTDLVNPINKSGGAWNRGNSGNEWHVNNQGFIDDWGLPLFYWRGSNELDDGGPRALFRAQGNVTSYVFNHSNPDSRADVQYTTNGVSGINSRIVPYTPAGLWKSSTPIGSTMRLGGDDTGVALPAGVTPPTKFRALLGMSNPSSPSVPSTDRIVGSTSFLIVSAGPDNIYYTGDEILNEYAK